MREDAHGLQQLFCNRVNFWYTLFRQPPPVSTIKCMNVRFQQRVPFVIYKRFQALFTPYE